MVVNTSHSEYMNNRDKRESHRLKLAAFDNDDIIKEDECENVAAGFGTQDGKISGFSRFKMPLSERLSTKSSVGLDRLNAMRKDNSAEGIFDPHDLDYLLWHKEAKEVASGVHFAQMLNFEGITGTLNVEFSAVAEDVKNTANYLTCDYTVEYPVFRNPLDRVRVLSNANTKEGPKTGMVRLVSQATHAVGLSEAVAGKGVGVEMSLMSGKNVTKMHTIKSKPVDMRQMALKAMLLKLQLTLLYACEEGKVEVTARKLSVNVPVLKTSEALELFPKNKIIVDVTKFSDEQRNLLLVLCSSWPSQKLFNDSYCDIYSLVEIEPEAYAFYVTCGESIEIKTEGYTPSPRELWSQCVQLFMNMGGFDDLVCVVRDNRGFAPILTYNAGAANNVISVISAYPSSTCYHGLSVSTSPERRYIAPTLLESSSLVMLVDSIMLSVYLNNVLYLAEELGLGSTTLYPRPDARNNSKIADVLYSHGLKGNSPHNCLMDKVCPWLAKMDRFQNSGTHVLLETVNAMRRGGECGLIYCPLNYAVSTVQDVCTASLMRGLMPVDLSTMMGFRSNVSKTWEVMRLLNWYKAFSGTSTPCYGTSLFGAKIKGDELQVLRHMIHMKGDFRLNRVMAVTAYHPQSAASGTLQQTFFNNPGYISSEQAKVQESYPVQYKPNSFSINAFGDDGEAGKTTGGGGKSNAPVGGLPSPVPGPAPGGVVPKPGGAPGQLEVVPPRGELQVVDIPKVTESPVPYVPGDCGVDALVSLIPGATKAESLARLGLGISDNCWLTADELAKVAASYDHDLIVVKDKGAPEYYHTGASLRPNRIVLRQAGGHFTPCREAGGSTLQPTLVVEVEPLRNDSASKSSMRSSILIGQETRGIVPQVAGPVTSTPSGSGKSSAESIIAVVGATSIK